jgi:hypothetical protein
VLTTFRAAGFTTMCWLASACQVRCAPDRMERGPQPAAAQGAPRGGGGASVRNEEAADLRRPCRGF